MSSSRPQLYTPQPPRNPPRLLPSSLPRAMPALTPAKTHTTSTANKENSPQPNDGFALPTKTAIFLSPPSAVSTRSTISSIRSSVSPLSTSSINSLHMSPRAALAPRSPNIRLLPVRPVDLVKQTAPLKVKQTAAPAAANKAGKRTSPPLLGQRKQAALLNNNKPKRSSPPTSSITPSSTSTLQKQIDQLQAQLAAEQTKARTLASELRTTKVELIDARRRSVWMTVEDEEAVERYWHDVAGVDFYDAVNSDRSSGSEADEDGEEDDEKDDEHEDEDDDEEASDDEDEDEEDAEDDDAESHVTESDLGADSASEDDQPLALPVIARSPQKRDSTSDLDSVTQQLATLSCQPHKASTPDKPRLSLSSIHNTSHTSHAQSQQDDEDSNDDDDDDDAEAEAEASDADTDAHSAASTSSIVSLSTPGFTDAFPYERNLYLLARHYHIHTRLYSCPDAITFKAYSPTHHTAVVLKLSEGYSRRRAHPKEVRVLTSAQGHPNIMRLRGWWGVVDTGCYCFVTDWVDNCGVDRLWDSERDRREYMRGLLQGLAHLHSRNILYRDVKPSNVLWNAETRHVTIIDFDVATYYNPAAGHRSIVGTSGYMAPEMLAIERDGSGTYGQQVDVYSAGVVLGQLVYRIYEDEVADESRCETKGAAMVERVLKFAEENGGRIGAEHHLMLRMLTDDPAVRITVQDALQHPYFTQSS